MSLEGICQQLGLRYEENALGKIASETRTAGLEIIDAKGATYYGISAAMARIVRAMLRDEHAVLAVSTLVPESMQLGEVSLSLPAIINRDGVARVLEVPLNDSELRALQASAEIVKSYIASLDLATGTVA